MDTTVEDVMYAVLAAALIIGIFIAIIVDAAWFGFVMLVAIVITLLAGAVALIFVSIKRAWMAFDRFIG